MVAFRGGLELAWSWRAGSPSRVRECVQVGARTQPQRHLGGDELARVLSERNQQLGLARLPGGEVRDGGQRQRLPCDWVRRLRSSAFPR